MNSSDFKSEITRLINDAKKQGEHFIDITSGEVHRNVGGYPSNNHRMPLCCEVMYSMMKDHDEVLYSPLKGKGARLKIRYIISEGD